MKVIFLGLVLVGFAVVFSLVITNKEIVTRKAESSFVKYKIKDLPQHGISLLAPSDPALSKELKPIDPYSVFLRNTSSRPIVGYAIKWECFDGKNESANRNTFYDRHLRSGLGGVVFMYGEETDRKAILNRLEEVIWPNSTWLISYDLPARPIGTVTKEDSPEINEAAVAEMRAACPEMTITLDGVFFDDGRFVGPDTIGFFTHVETQVAMRLEVFQKVLTELKSGKTPTEVFQGLEQIANSESTEPRAETEMSRTEFRQLFARDVVGMRNIWGVDKAIEKIQLQVSKPWLKPRKSED
ncbi:MAG TPA: hypothetical protein VFH31_17855 [Pyrinomonadaceae bacterium]|nr:hypothetical protein [Pyrinomonadaceae bacterium]